MVSRCRSERLLDAAELLGVELWKRDSLGFIKRAQQLAQELIRVLLPLHARLRLQQRVVIFAGKFQLASLDELNDFGATRRQSPRPAFLRYTAPRSSDMHKSAQILYL
jgi:hypothetical protein